MSHQAKSIDSQSIETLHKILQNLTAEFDLPPLASMNVAVLRSKVSLRSPAVDAMYEQMVRTLGRRGELLPKA